MHYSTKGRWRFFSLFLSIIFLVTNNSYAIPAIAQAKAWRPVLAIPPEFGSIQESYSGFSDRFVIYLQDAHSHPEAQWNNYRILENISKQFPVDTIFVEGTTGLVDTTPYLDLPDYEITLKTAENLLNKGYITGEEYFSLASKSPRIIHGIESPDLYRENINGLKEILKYKEENIFKIEGLRLSLDTEGFNKELRECYNLYKGYSIGDISLSDYAAHLTSERENLKKFLSLLDLEKTIDFDVVNKERDELIDRLTNLLSTEEARELVSRSLEFRLNRITALEYYQYVTGLSDVIPNNLSNYLSYLRQYHELDRVKLLREIEEESEDTLERLCQNSEEKVLLKKLKNLDLIEKLLDTSLTPSEWSYLKRNQSLESLPVGFYLTAEKRDSILAENLIQHLNFTGTKQAVLITGGFHTDGIARLLRQKGISYIVIAPVITKKDNSNRETYINLVTKNGNGYKDILASVLGKNTPIALKAPEQTGDRYFFNLFAIAAALVQLQGELTSEKVTQANRIITEQVLDKYARKFKEDVPKLTDAYNFLVNLAKSYKDERTHDKKIIAIIVYKLAANLARIIGRHEEAEGLNTMARNIEHQLPSGLITMKAAAGQSYNADIQAGEKNDWFTMSTDGAVETRYYLSRPVLVDGINGKWKKRYFGSRARGELDRVLAQLRALGIRELRQGDKHVQYAIVTPEIEAGQSEIPFSMAIIEEHPDGERILWTKPTPGLTEEQRYGQLLEFLVPLNARPRIRPQPGWREEGFTTTKSTQNYRKEGWSVVQASVDFGACDGCLQCAVNCPDASLWVDQDGDFIGVDRDHCSGCSSCERVCPIRAITMPDKKNLTGTFVSKIDGDKGERTELAGGLVKELTDKLTEKGLLTGEAVILGDFTVRKAYLDDNILQVELIHREAEPNSRPLVITFLKEDGQWQRAWLRQKKAILAYGMGELELQMIQELQKEGYSIIGAVDRERFSELRAIPNSEWERANNRKDEFAGKGLYIEGKRLMEVLDTGGVDVVVTGESSWLRAVDKRAIMQKTGYGLWVISPHNILETRDKVLDSVMERIYEDVQKIDPRLWYKFIPRVGYSTSLFARFMRTARGLARKVSRGLSPGHRLCPACPQPKIVEDVCQMAANMAAKDKKVVKRLILVNTGCLTASGMSNLHGTAFRDPAGRILFGNAVCVASGVEAGLKYLKKMERLHPDEKFEIIVFTGDGGDADIGLQGLLAAVERGHKIRYFVFNNEAYMNTGAQKSGATSFGARTKSTVPGPVIPGYLGGRKIVADLVAQNHDALVIETNPEEEPHFIHSLEKAFEHDGFVYCNISSTCHTGQGYLGEHARSVSTTRIDTGMSPLVIREETHTELEIPPKLRNRKLEESLLYWLSQQKFIQDFTDSEGEKIFVEEGKGIPLVEGKIRININKKYKALALLRFFQPVLESMKIEGRFGHLLDKGKIKEGLEPIVYINQLDVIIRLLMLFKDSGEFGDEYSRKEYKNLLRAMIEMRKKQKIQWGKREVELLKKAVKEEEEEKKKVTIDEDLRNRNANRLGKETLNIEWFGFAGWGVQEGSNFTSDILHLLGLYPINWPSFGPERKGAPVEAYNKDASTPLSDRSDVKKSQIAMVFDEIHLERPEHRNRIFKKLDKDGIIFINTPLSPTEARERFGIPKYHIVTADLSGIAGEKIGDRTKVNIASLGALVRILELKGFEVDVSSIKKIFEGTKLGTPANLACFDHIYSNTQIEFNPPTEGRTKRYELPQDTSQFKAAPLDWYVATGSEAVVKAVTQTPYGAGIFYAITPSTPPMEQLSSLKAKGKIDMEVMLMESEYAAMSAAVGAAATGVMSFTATSSQGLLLMHEVLPVAAGLGLPIIMYVANRAITRKDLSIYVSHDDAMAQLTTGWVQLYAKNNQELYDLMIMAPVLWKYLRAPIMVNGDGFNLSHTSELVTYLTDEQVKEFQKEVEAVLYEIWKGTMAPGSAPGTYAEGVVAQDRRLSLDIAMPKIMEVFNKYKDLAKRSYEPIVEYGDPDADIAIIAQGSVVSTIEKAIEMARDLGISAKVIDIKSMVPFPYDKVEERIRDCETVVVMDRSTSPGLYPPLFKEVRSASRHERIYDEVYGLGGRNPQPEDIVEIMKKAVLVRGSGYKTEGELEVTQEIKDLLLELAYLHIYDMKLDQNPFPDEAAEERELQRYLEEQEKLIRRGDYIGFMRPVGYADVREGIEDERNKRIRVIELLEIARAVKAIEEEETDDWVKLYLASVILNFSSNIENRRKALDKVRVVMDVTTGDIRESATRLFNRFKMTQEGMPTTGLTNIHPTGELETTRLLDAVPEGQKKNFEKGYRRAVNGYLARKEQIYIPRLLGVVPETPEYEELRRQSSLKPSEFDQLYIRQSALFLDKEMFALESILAGVEKGETKTEGWAATARVTVVEEEKTIQRPGALPQVVKIKKPKIVPIIERLLVEKAGTREDYETIVAAIYHELVETNLALFVKRLGLEQVYTKDRIHEMARQLEIKNFGASRVNPFVSRAHMAALEIEAEISGNPPSDPASRRYYLQNQLLKRLMEEEVPVFTGDEQELLDELVQNGYSGVVKDGDRYRLAGLRKLTDEELGSAVVIEDRQERYSLTGETKIDPMTGLKKVYLGNEVIPTLIEILTSIGDTDSIAKIKAGGKAALLEKEGYPLYLGIVWEGVNGDTVLWSKEPTRESGLKGAFYTNYLSLLNASALRGPERRFAELGYEGYESGTMLDLEGISSIHRKTSDWAERQPIINWAKCVNCLHCAFKCPDAAMIVQDGTLIGVNPDHCKGCGVCEGECRKQGHNAIVMMNKDELAGFYREDWLKKGTKWQTRIRSGLANNLYGFLTDALGDKDSAVLGDYIVSVAYKGTLPTVTYDGGEIGGDNVLQLRLLPKTAPAGTKPLVYTFIKSPGSGNWQLVVKPQKNVLVLGTGETEARIAVDSIRQGFEVRVVRRFSPDNQPVYYDVEELEKYTNAFNSAGLWASKDVIDLVNAYGQFYQSDQSVRFISHRIESLRKRLGTQIPDYLVTGDLGLISPKIKRASIPLTAQPVIAPGEAYISRDKDLDGIMDNIFQTIPHATIEAYARHADITIPKGHLDAVANYMCHFAGGHGLCTGCDAGIIANKIIAASVAAGEKLGKKMRIAFVGATGCLEVATTIDMISYGPATGPKYKLQISYYHSAFTNLGASISGVVRAWEARKAYGDIPKDEELIVVGVGGDGGTHDIGLQALSGAWERGEKVFYIEYNNGGYMNTGVQRSSGTPEGASTSTSPGGKEQEEKDLPEILASHSRDSKHLVMTSSTHDIGDFMAKLEQGILHAINTGPAYLGVCATCVPGQKLSSPEIANKTNQIAVETASFVSFTIKDGLLELADYTPEVPEWDPQKKDWVFRYLYKGKEYSVYGDDYIKRRNEFVKKHLEDGGRNMRWITARPVIDRLWAEGRFRQVREDMVFVQKLQRKIVERLEEYHKRNRNTKKIDRILRVILDGWKEHSKYKNIFQTVKDTRDLERDIYADIKPEHRALIGHMRRYLASHPILEKVQTGNEIHLLIGKIQEVMVDGLIPEDEKVKLARSIINLTESALIGEEKLEELRRQQEERKAGEKTKVAPAVEGKPQLVTPEQKENNNRVLSKELVIDWRSRGGVGAIMANKLFAKILLELGLFESDFPFFGPERQGAPVQAFLVTSGRGIRSLGASYYKDFTIVLDEKAWEEIQPDYTGEEIPKFLHGQAEDGILIVNTTLSPSEVRDRYKLYGRWNSLKIYTVDASGITERIADKQGEDPVQYKPNMTLLGAAIRAFQYFGIQYNKDILFKLAEKGIGENFNPKVTKILAEAFAVAHESIQEEEDSPKMYAERISLMAEKIEGATAERYPEGVRLDGNEAAAKFYEQVANHQPTVFATYPITPTTLVGEILSGVKARYLQYLPAESEHSALSACVAAALSGSVAGFATGSQGLIYALEAAFLADDLRAPGLVLYCGNREINHPLNILYGRSDSDSWRRGWLKFIASNQQEVYDFGFISLLASYLARRPAQIDYAAFFVTHTGSNVKLLGDDQVRQISEMVDKLRKLNRNIIDDRKAWGYVAGERTFEERRYGETESVEIASQRAILDAMQIFSEITGRKYDYFKTHQLEDAEQVVSIVGAHGKIVQKAVDELREEGIKVGMLWPRVNGPFVGDKLGPEYISGLLKDKRVLQVIEHFADDGEVYSPLATQIATALFSEEEVVPLMNWIAALGGRTLDVNMVKEVIKLGIALGGRKQLTVTSTEMDPILAMPEVQMVINRLVTIYRDKLVRNLSPGYYTDEKLDREVGEYREKITGQLANRKYTKFLNRKEYLDVRRESRELEVKIRLIKFIELTLARQYIDSQEGDTQYYLAQVLYYLSSDFHDQDKAIELFPDRFAKPSVVTAGLLLCADNRDLDLKYEPYEGKPGVYKGTEKGGHTVGYHAALVDIDGQKVVALNPTFIERLEEKGRLDLIDAVVFHETNEPVLGHDEVLRQEKERWGVSPVDPAYSLAQHYAILNEVEKYRLPELNEKTGFIHQYYRRWLAVRDLFRLPLFTLEAYEAILPQPVPGRETLLSDLDLFLRNGQLIRIGKFYLSIKSPRNGALVEGMNHGVSGFAEAASGFSTNAPATFWVNAEGVIGTKAGRHFRAGDDNVLEFKFQNSRVVADLIKASGLLQFTVKNGTTKEQWLAFIERLLKINRRQSVDPYLGQAFSEWRGDGLKEITQPRTILFTLEALEDNIYDAPARALIEKLTSSNVTIAIAAKDEKDARIRLERINFPITDNIRFITYTDQPDVSSFRLSSDTTVLTYNERQEFVNATGFKAVKISHGVSLPQAFTFIIGLFNKPLADVVADLKTWLQSKGFSKDEIEEIVRAIPDQGIILPLPAVEKLTDNIQADHSDQILISA